MEGAWQVRRAPSLILPRGDEAAGGLQVGAAGFTLCSGCAGTGARVGPGARVPKLFKHLFAPLIFRPDTRGVYVGHPKSSEP